MSRELDTIPLLEQASAQLADLRTKPPIPVEITAEAAMVLISQLQLALRHPQNQGEGSRHARLFIQGLRRRIAKPGDPLDRLIGMGFEEQYDEEPFPYHQPPRPRPPT